MTQPPKSRPSGQSDTARAPRAFRVDADNVVLQEHAGGEQPVTLSGSARIIPEPEMLPEVSLHTEPKGRPAKRSTAWGKLLLAALGGLITLAIGLTIDGLIRDLFARTDWLGWTALALAALAVIALVALLLREVIGLMRLRRIDRIRTAITTAAENDDAPAARSALAELTVLYRARRKSVV